MTSAGSRSNDRWHKEEAQEATAWHHHAAGLIAAQQDRPVGHPAAGVRLGEVHLEKKQYEADFEYCKGCAMCAEACPFDAITMEEEHR
jgi:ferredoxin